MSDTNSTLVYYVATDGNDSWSGTFPSAQEDGTDGPFATLGRARDVVRTVNVGIDDPADRKPVTVLIRGGEYELEETLEF